MLRGLLTASLLLASLLALPLIGNAQYMYLDANGDGIHTAADQLNASGATSLDVWLDTTHDRNGSPQSCNSHSGAPTSGAPLDIFSYSIVLQAMGGSVSWGTFNAADPAYTPEGTDLADSHDTEFNRRRPESTVTPAGLVKLGTIQVTILSGAPHIGIGTSTPLDPFGFGTGFGTDCEGNSFQNSYVLASPGDASGDWFDTDGVDAPAGLNHPPSLSAPAMVTAAAGAALTINVSATDADAGDVLTITASGAPASLAFASSPGPSPATATLSGTPTFAEAAGSPYAILWSVNDGAGGNGSANTALTITRTDTAPVVSAPATALFAETFASDFGVGFGDPEGDPITNVTTSPLPAGVTFTLSAFNTAGHFEWTPASGQAGTYPVTFTAASMGPGLPALMSSGTTNVIVGPPDHRPIVSLTPTSYTINEGQHIHLTPTASDPDGDPLTSFTCKGTQNTGLPAGLTFTTSPDFHNGTLDWTPDFNQASVYHFDLETTSVGSLGEQISAGLNGGGATVVLVINVRNLNRLPALSAPASLSVNEGVLLTYLVSATDADGDHVTLSASSLPLGAGFTDHGDNTGTFSWTPSFSQAGTYTVTVAGNDGHGGVATAATDISVLNVNRAPVSNPGGPYSGLTNVPVNFDGSASSDPDGDALTYAWSFGDASTGSGAMASHTYTAGGTYTVTLTVTDAGAPPLSTSASTTAVIVTELAANVFYPPNLNIILPEFIPTWVWVEPVGSAFNTSDINLASFTMQYAGLTIHNRCKTVRGGDTNHNGIQEVRVCFTRDDLRTLFASLPGHATTTVSVVVGGDLSTGGHFKGAVTVRVIKFGASGSASMAAVSPNPLNPEATLTFATSRPGTVKVEMFDIQGRLVRTILNSTFMSEGPHETKIDGRGQNGEKLASGIYFVRGVTVDGVFKNAVTILK